MKGRVRAFAGNKWREVDLKDEAAEYPIVGNDLAGNVFLCWQQDDKGFISLLNANSRSEAVEIDAPKTWSRRIIPCGAGGVYLAWVDPKQKSVLVVRLIQTMVSSTYRAGG